MDATSPQQPDESGQPREATVDPTAEQPLADVGAPAGDDGVDDAALPLPDPMTPDGAAPTGRNRRTIAIAALAGVATVAGGFAIGTAIADGGHDHHGRHGVADGRGDTDRDGDRRGDDGQAVPRGMTPPQGGFQGGSGDQRGMQGGGMQGQMPSTRSHGS